MKFVVIFVEGNPLLISPKKVGINSIDALNKLFGNWDNNVFLWDFFRKNIPEIELQDDSEIVIENAVTRVMQEAYNFSKAASY